MESATLSLSLSLSLCAAGRTVPRLTRLCPSPSQWRLDRFRSQATKPSKGFGPQRSLPSKKKKTMTTSTEEKKKKKKGTDADGDGEDDEEEQEEVVPEVVTNRMLKRIGLTVGAPLGIGLLFFPLFYYLKVVRKVDLPEWVPLLTSLLVFGVSALGITYGVVSTSWDPVREGSLLGWKEAQANWPVFLQTLRGKQEEP